MIIWTICSAPIVMDNSIRIAEIANEKVHFPMLHFKTLAPSKL